MTDATALADTLKAICVAHSNGTLNPYEKAVLRQAAALLEPLSPRLASAERAEEGVESQLRRERDEADEVARSLHDRNTDLARQHQDVLIHIDHFQEIVEGDRDQHLTLVPVTKREVAMEKALRDIATHPLHAQAHIGDRAAIGLAACRSIASGALATQAPPASSTEGKME
jgi:hypothetical protein